ncbi:MAG: heterodisulfide reductase-related iron-sulfur binding cluster [Halobacteriota archaeon]
MEGKIKSQGMGITQVLMDYPLREEDMKKFRIRWLLTDPRVSNFYSCIQCGACTSICTAASIDKKYNPRRLVECLITGGDIEDYPLEKCFSCHACKYACRKGNCVADIVKVLKENMGLNINCERCEEELHYKSLYGNGLCVTVDTLSPDTFPEWGSSWEKIQNNMKKIRSELGLEGLYREIPKNSLDEIREIVDITENKKFKKEGEIEEVKKRIPKNKIYLFHSCHADAHYPGITTSIKYIFDELNIDYIDDPRHSTCTGFAYYGDKISLSTMLAVNARNFALAAEAGYPNIASVCQTCYGVLTESAGILKSGIGKQVNEEVLSRVNRKFKGEVNIAHVSEILWAQRKRIKDKIKHRLDGLRVATHNGCHYTKMFRKSAVPNLLDELASVTGAESVDYAEKSLCCGMGFGHTIEQERRHLTREIAQRKLLSAKEAGADIVLVACPGCQITLDRNQELIEKESGVEIGLPIVNYAQLIALAMDADVYKVVGVQSHSVPLEPILEEVDIL